MKFLSTIASVLTILSLSGIAFAEDSDSNASGNNTLSDPQPGLDYAVFDTGVELKQGKSRGPVIWYLGYLFYKNHFGKCKFGREGCCYGKDTNGCCLGGGNNQCPPCQGLNCPIPCLTGREPGCPPPICPGPNCPYPCPGPNCPYICPGPLCPKLCPGPRCPIVCPGPNCPVPCPGPLCPVPCYGPNCGNIICPPQVCNIGFNGRPIIFNVNINQNIIINNNSKGKCIIIYEGLKPIKICGPDDCLRCDRLPNNQYQVKILKPTDDRLSITPLDQQ
ncbi:hypothetical protein K502DRAFT_351033 [Neoconidiobolus thromboides FSU 785]|nr:hypothetical protein K502DRAFT_351033 [Neoconidiobolus thromboides FSU 785]